MERPLLIFSDSNALIGDIRFVFKDKLECVSSDSIDWVERYLQTHAIKLLIADLDMDIPFETEVLEGLRENREDQIVLLYLVSERRKLELERDLEFFPGDLSSDLLVKPFSRDNLIDSVVRLCG